MHPHGALVLLGRMAQVPGLLGDLDLLGLDQATNIAAIKGLQGLFDWSVCQPEGFAARPRVPPVPGAHDHHMEQIGLEVPRVVLACRLWRPLLVIDDQSRQAHTLSLLAYLPLFRTFLGERKVER
jgi:hypothetical protein